jgi:2-polyprenyl-3-methyl-5-hydroxy-6-metoxy-1,4-benzoquinol methylase
MSNATLRDTYDQVYRNGSAAFYTVDSWEESLLIHTTLPSWRGLKVLEIGCGEGRLAALLAMSGAHVTAVDYSDEALRIAADHHRLPNLRFTDAAPNEWFDAVVLQGTLEHMDDWRACLDELVERHQPERIITSSPSFLNPRGYIGQALRILLDVPMSLTDQHYICPPDMERLCRERDWDLTYKSCHQDWAAGHTLIMDYAKRLPNALRDAKLETSRVCQLLTWLQETQEYHVPTDWSGATVCYRIAPREGRP